MLLYWPSLVSIIKGCCTILNHLVISLLSHCGNILWHNKTRVYHWLSVRLLQLHCHDPSWESAETFLWWLEWVPCKGKRVLVPHLGSLDVSHVIPQQLCEFQLLVRRYSSLYLLQEHKDKKGLQNWGKYLQRHLAVAKHSAYSELFKQVRQLLQVSENGKINSGYIKLNDFATNIRITGKMQSTD